MNDWRLINEEFFTGITLYKIIFPHFWDLSYIRKNKFYFRTQEYAKYFILNTRSGKEFLLEENIRKIWHAHCDFCTREINPSGQIECYCTDDYLTWVCSTCYADFKERLRFNLREQNELL